MLFFLLSYNVFVMKLFNSKEDALYLTRTQWKKVFIAMSIIVIALYAIAMIFSLCGNQYFILNYQNEQMDRIENFMRSHSIMGFITCLFLTLEFTIVISFVLNKRTRIYYPLAFYGIAILIAFIFPDITMTIFYFYPFIFYLIIPIIEQFIDNRKAKEKQKFSWKKYGIQILRLLIGVVVTLILQAMITVIKAGYFDGKNHVLPLSGYFVYSLEYDIALSVILFTISLCAYREKGDSTVWVKFQVHGGSSQTSKMKSQKSSVAKKNLTKTQRNKLRFLYFKLYLIQLGAFAIIMVLPFLLGKVFEFLVMYFAFVVIRYILGFNYSLHYKKESLCVLVGVIVFGILTLAVPFFYVDMIIAVVMGVGLAIMLHLSYKYKGFYLFNKAAKPDKFALLYVYFDGDLDSRKIKNKCRAKNLDEFQVNLINDFMQGNKISYLAFKNNYSQRMLIYKLDEAIQKLTA